VIFNSYVSLPEGSHVEFNRPGGWLDHPVSPAGSLSGRATLSFGGGRAGASGATGQRFTGVGFLTLLENHRKTIGKWRFNGI